MKKELKEITNLEEAWDACLALWKELSRKKGCYRGDQERFKNKILKKLGYKPITHGCPFCGLFNAPRRCPNCPIQKPMGKEGTEMSCFNTPYKDWSETPGHRPKLAQAFYEYLLELKE